MNAFFAGLQSLIITVRRNAFSSLFTTVMLLVLIFTWSARDNIVTFLERNPSTHQEKQRFDEAVLADSQINDALAEVREHVNSDRILIRQFHNSRADMTGLPFASVSTTYYAMAPGITLAPESFQAYPLSTINDQLGRMFIAGEEPQCVTIRTDQDVKNPNYYNYLKINGVVLSYTCPLMNLRGQPVGFISVGYLTETKDRPEDEEIKRILADTGDKVVGYLSQVTNREKKPWYETIFNFED